MRLDELKPGQKGIVAELSGEARFINRACAFGFTPGTGIVMIRNHARGPLIAYLRDTVIAMGRPEAACVILAAAAAPEKTA
jgi:ferrous iron transport protein A